MALVFISTSTLAHALTISSASVRGYIAARDTRFGGYQRTPGGHHRWTPARAAEIVAAFGREVPATWKERAK